MENEILLRQYIQKVWNEKDFDSIPNFVSPAYIIVKDPADPWEGKTLNFEEFAMRLDYTFDSFPDIHFEIKTVTSCGDDVDITWIMTGTHSGTTGVFFPTGKLIHTTGSTIYHFRNGKVSGHSQVFD